MLMAESSTYVMFAFLKKNRYIDGWAVNIWHVFVSKYINFKIWKYKLVVCWWLSSASYFSYYKPIENDVICWQLSRQHIFSFSKMQTCQHMTCFEKQMEQCFNTNFMEQHSNKTWSNDSMDCPVGHFLTIYFKVLWWPP